MDAIKLWIGRDKSGLYLFRDAPTRDKYNQKYWETIFLDYMPINATRFPSVTIENSPQQVELRLMGTPGDKRLFTLTAEEVEKLTPVFSRLMDARLYDFVSFLPDQQLLDLIENLLTRIEQWRDENEGATKEDRHQALS